MLLFFAVFGFPRLVAAVWLDDDGQEGVKDEGARPSCASMPVRVQSCFAMDRRRAGAIRFETIDACATLPEDFAVSEQSL